LQQGQQPIMGRRQKEVRPPLIKKKPITTPESGTKDVRGEERERNIGLTPNGENGGFVRVCREKLFKKRTVWRGTRKHEGRIHLSYGHGGAKSSGGRGQKEKTPLLLLQEVRGQRTLSTLGGVKEFGLKENIHKEMQWRRSNTDSLEKHKRGRTKPGNTIK